MGSIAVVPLLPGGAMALRRWPSLWLRVAAGREDDNAVAAAGAVVGGTPAVNGLD